MKAYRPSIFYMFLCIFLAACAAGPDLQATATADALHLQNMVETESAVMVGTTVAQVGTQTALAVPTALPSATLTSTPLPTATVTPGPLVIADDFSSLNARWQGCDGCTVQDGALNFGPYTSANSAKGYITLCADCGVVHEYRMSVDATFLSGVSDRGFGLILRETNGDFIDLEITTWQLYGVWFYDSKEGDAWTAWRSLFSNGFTPTPYLNPGRILNHIDVEVKDSGTGNKLDLVRISFNGTLLNTVEVPSGSGQVGLGVGLHSIGVAFDNFHFEGMPEAGSGN